VLPGDFRSFFHEATASLPYPYQEKLATEAIQSRLIHIPTGCGESAAVFDFWLIRGKSSEPRRAGESQNA